MAEKNQAQAFCPQSQQALMKHRPLPKAVVVANGSLAPAGTDPGHYPGLRDPVGIKLGHAGQRRLPRAEATVITGTTSSHLPSRFLKGATTQLPWVRCRGDDGAHGGPETHGRCQVHGGERLTRGHSGEPVPGGSCCAPAW